MREASAGSHVWFPHPGSKALFTPMPKASDAAPLLSVWMRRVKRTIAALAKKLPSAIPSWKPGDVSRQMVAVFLLRFEHVILARLINRNLHILSAEFRASSHLFPPVSAKNFYKTNCPYLSNLPLWLYELISKLESLSNLSKLIFISFISPLWPSNKLTSNV